MTPDVPQTKVPTVAPKKLSAKLTIQLPNVEADPQAFDSFDVETMKKNYMTQIEENLLEVLEGPFEDETFVQFDVQVTVVD
jgi:hypothetical protein